MPDRADLVAIIGARLRQLDEQIAPLAEERERLEVALDALAGVRTDVGTIVAEHGAMAMTPSANDTRLPSVRVPTALVERVWAVVGKRGFALFVREALERQLRRTEVRSQPPTAK